MKKTIAVLTSFLALSGCASILDPNGASSSYSCVDPNDPDSVVDGVTCKTPFAIYKSTHEPAPLKQSDLPIGVTLQDHGENTQVIVDVDQAPDDGGVLNSVYQSQSYQLPGQLQPQDQAQYARPVRVPATVMRIWLAPWIDSHDNLHFPERIFTEIEPRRWAYGSNEYNGRGMTVPTKLLNEVPAKEVKPNDRQPRQADATLQPYTPTSIGTGSQMPTLP